jgi:hypothetical protein
MDLNIKITDLISMSDYTTPSYASTILDLALLHIPPLTPLVKPIVHVIAPPASLSGAMPLLGHPCEGLLYSATCICFLVQLLYFCITM